MRCVLFIGGFWFVYMRSVPRTCTAIRLWAFCFTCFHSFPLSFLITFIFFCLQADCFGHMHSRISPSLLCHVWGNQIASHRRVLALMLSGHHPWQRSNFEMGIADCFLGKMHYGRANKFTCSNNSCRPGACVGRSVHVVSCFQCTCTLASEFFNS